jgi:hypothetical protein
MSLEAAGVPDFLASPRWMDSEMLSALSSVNWVSILGEGEPDTSLSVGMV